MEPFRTWQGSMVAQAGRDPFLYAALAIANQDAAHAGETCIRCHLAKGWLEGRSAPEDATALTADDREGVQCSVCHRLVDPVATPGNPPEDAAILAGLAAAVPIPGSAMMVVDPLDRLRGPFDVVTDLGSDPHRTRRTTIVSPFHRSSRMCGTCHDVGNSIFTRNAMGAYDPNPLGAAGDPSLAFPEQATYSEWAASAYAAGPVLAPQFGGNREAVSTCQDCHMRAASGNAAAAGRLRDDLPLHALVGANAFVPAILPDHPVFGAEVDPAVMAEAVARATDLVRRAARLTVALSGGVLTVRVYNDAGHKLPTGYPDGRRMWLHVRAFGAGRQVVFESGRYEPATGELIAYGAAPSDPDYDPWLRVWETLHGMTPAWAAQVGQPPGPSFHLALNNTIEKDNRIPPRGFANAGFAAFGGQPVGATYADGQYWDDAVYPVGAATTSAEITLYYQTASKEYVEFLRDENVTDTTGSILHDLWDTHGKGAPVAMAHAFFESDVGRVNRCRSDLARAQARYWKQYVKTWGECFAAAAAGASCDAGARDQRLAEAEAKLRAAIGGPKDRSCAPRDLTPITLGHAAVCPPPCAGPVTLYAIDDVASCARCQVEALGAAALGAVYGAEPPTLPGAGAVGEAAKCRTHLAKASLGLASRWTRALVECEAVNAATAGSVDCAGDPKGQIAKARERAGRLVDRCSDYAGLAGCATSGDPSAVRACIEAAVGSTAPGYASVAYP